MPSTANKRKAEPAPRSQQPSSRKRRLDGDKNMQKYYAVRAGVRPGIYLTWIECQAQIAGFKGAQCELLGTTALPPLTCTRPRS